MSAERKVATKGIKNKFQYQIIRRELHEIKLYFKRYLDSTDV